MDTEEKSHKNRDSLEREKINRRKFLTKSVGYTACLTLLAFPGMLTEALAAGDKSKEEILKELDELVDRYLPIYGTCSQTSFYALNKVFDLKAEAFVKSLASMPGIASRGETCGAVTGCLLGIGMFFEEDNPVPEKRGLSREPSEKFCSKFEEKYGSTRCRDVISRATGKTYNLTKPEDYIPLAESGAYEQCPNVIKNALHIAAEVILENA